MATEGQDPLQTLQGQWKYLYADYLPTLAKARDPVQRRWPVHLDHCFARIVLDNAIGATRPWTEVVKSPAIMHMSEQQLRGAIQLAEQLATGQADLVLLNEHSLQLRGKKRKSDAEADSITTSKKQKSETGAISAYFVSSSESGVKRSSKEATSNEAVSRERDEETDMSLQLKRIRKSDLTPFRKLTLSLLCEVPRGRYSTYQAMSDHVTKSSHKTCARAIGNAMRNNPFAPEVPCHRILAADGTLGGFKGSWGETGQYAQQKHRILHEEGIRFDSKGRAKGPPFTAFNG